ncbi:MAG: ABC transporter permease subunit [Planctomycetes bacterium]|nr:ABC transporter permease subunit [Planctomycetota bacterium]
MIGLLPVFRRELSGYFTTPVALVFIVIFLFLAGVFTFQLGRFFERGQADMVVFFTFHPWLYLFLIPAISMRLWAEERKTGTIELLLTLPVSLSAAVVGKFLAAWAFAGIALGLTFPLWITVNYLGNPDNGVILAGYLGSLLMAGAFLAIGSCISAATKSQVIAFIVSVVICLLFMLAGLKEVQAFVTGWLPQEAVKVVGSFSFLTRFEAISKGVLDVRDVLFFASIIGVFVAATGVVVNMKKAE